MESKSPVKSELEAYLESHPEFIQTWLKEKASPETKRKVLTSCTVTPVIGTAGRGGVGERVHNETINTSSIVNNNNNNSSLVNNNTVRGAAAASSPGPAAEPATSIGVTESVSVVVAGATATTSRGGGAAFKTTATTSATDSCKASASTGSSAVSNSPSTTPPEENNDEITPVQRPRSHSKRNSITSDRFQSWISSSSPKHKADRAVPPGLVAAQLDHLDENELFIELVKDISNELNIDILCHKILVNVGYLTQADRCSLFLARGPSDKRHLIAKLWDVTVDSGKDNLWEILLLFSQK